MLSRLCTSFRNYKLKFCKYGRINKEVVCFHNRDIMTFWNKNVYKKFSEENEFNSNTFERKNTLKERMFNKPYSNQENNLDIKMTLMNFISSIKIEKRKDELDELLLEKYKGTIDIVYGHTNPLFQIIENNNL